MTRPITDPREALWPAGDALHGRHALAWLRYCVHRECPIKPATPKRETGSVGVAG